MLFSCFEAFLGKFTENFCFLVHKVTISEKSTETLRMFVFLNMFEKDANLEENLDLFKQLFFDQTIKRGQLLTKTVLLNKVSQIQLNYAFLLF